MILPTDLKGLRSVVLPVKRDLLLCSSEPSDSLIVKNLYAAGGLKHQSG